MSVTLAPVARASAAAACVVLGACANTITTPSPDIARDIVLVGDSTMSAYDPQRYPRMGWGMVLACGLRGGPTVVNLAASGRSTRSFMAEGRWQGALDALDAGDVMLIQFGHNDQKVEDPTRFTQPDGDFSSNLRVMVEGVRAIGAIPVLITPVARRRFVDGHAHDTHGQYSDAVRRVAQEMGVALVDLSADSLALLSREGEAGSRRFYLHYTPDDRLPAYPDGVADDTHFSEAGARAIAQLVVQRLAQLDASWAQLANPLAPALAPGFVAGGPACTKERP